MEKQLAFRVFLNENYDAQNIRSWFEWFADNIIGISSYDVIELYSIETSSSALRLEFFSGNKTYFSSEGISFPIAQKVFKSNIEYVFPQDEMEFDPFAQNKILENLPKWKIVLPIVFNDECVGVFSILSEHPFRQKEILLNRCREWAKQTGLLLKNISSKNSFENAGSSISNSLESVQELVFEVNEDFEIIFSNHSFKKFLRNFSGNKFSVSNNQLKSIFGNEFSEIISGVEKALNGVRSFSNKKILIGGEEKNFHFTFSPVTGAEKKCFCFATEISSVEKPIAVSAKRNSGFSDSLVQFISDIVWVVDERGTIKFVNSSFERITGYTSDEVIGKSSFEFFSREELPNHLQQMLLYLSGKNKRGDEYFEFKFIDKQGKNIVLESTAINQLDHQDIKGIIVSARNVTRQASERRELEDKEELYHSLFESLSEAILITDKNHYLVYCNSLLSTLTGYSMQELGSMPMYQLIVAEEYWQQVKVGINNRLNGNTEQYEVELVRKDGNRIWASITAAPYKSKTGEIVGSVGTITDITQRKKVEEEIRWLAKFPEENPS
ncbi:MAG: PAS domain-containing protein, partial [Bacteroidota bacterium]